LACMRRVTTGVMHRSKNSVTLYYLVGAHEQRRRYIEYRALGHFRSAHNHGVLSYPGTERPMKALESGGLRKAAERMA
jgi:hypothetical protein